MFRHLLCRSFSGKAASDKSVYQTLRSETGLPFIKIKEALLETDNDPVKAREWLQEKAASENWAKAQKLSQRETAQGLVGILSLPSFVGVSTLLCESESVSRNDKFQDVLHHCNMALQASGLTGNISPDELLKLSYNDTAISDMVTKTIGRLGENIKVKQCFAFSLNEPGLTHHHYVHNKMDSANSGLTVGTIGSVMIARNLQDHALGTTIAQHIVGSEETSENLLNQPLLQDESVTIGELCKKYEFEIVDHCRMSIH